MYELYNNELIKTTESTFPPNRYLNLTGNGITHRCFLWLICIIIIFIKDLVKINEFLYGPLKKRGKPIITTSEH